MILGNLRKDIEANIVLRERLRMLAASLAQLGREDEARKAVERLLLLLPGLTVERCRQTVPAKQTVHLETYMDGLRKAGLPE